MVRATLSTIFLVWVASGPSGAAWASDGLGAPITAETGDPWPIELMVELVPSGGDGVDPIAARTIVLERVVVGDGEELRVSRSLRTASGRLGLALSLVPHAHPGDAVELEWTLEVTEAPYQRLGLASYFLHRLRLGPGPSVGPSVLRTSRADIVTVHRGKRRESIQIGDRRYELHIFARALRG